MIAMALFSFQAFALEEEPGDDVSEETSSEIIVPRKVEVLLSPLSIIDHAYVIGVLFPISNQFVLGPKLSLFKDGELTHRTGYQIGARANYFLSEGWLESGLFVRAGIFYNHYEQNPSGCGKGGLCGDNTAYVSHGLSGDALFGYQSMLISSRFGIDMALGLKALQVDRTKETNASFLVYPTVELGVNLYF